MMLLTAILASLTMPAGPDPGDPVSIVSPDEMCSAGPLTLLPVLCRLPAEGCVDPLVLEYRVGEGTTWQEGFSLEVGRTQRMARLIFDLGRIDVLNEGDRLALRARRAGDREGLSAGKAIVVRVQSPEKEMGLLLEASERMLESIRGLLTSVSEQDGGLAEAIRTFGAGPLNKEQTGELSRFVRVQRAALSDLGDLQRSFSEFVLRLTCARALRPEDAGRGSRPARRIGRRVETDGSASDSVAFLRLAVDAEQGLREKLLRTAQEDNRELLDDLREADRFLETCRARLEAGIDARRLRQLQDEVNEDYRFLQKLRK